MDDVGQEAVFVGLEVALVGQEVDDMGLELAFVKHELA